MRKHLTKRLLAGVLALALLSGLCSASAMEAITYASGHAVGGAVNQGNVTEGLVNIVLPSVQQDFFDFVLDPSNFIATTNAAAYNGVAYREGSVYFRSVTDDGEVLLSPDSHPLTIINKGALPVEVDVSLTVDKGGYDFDFTDTPDFLDEDGEPVDGNAMYLALASGRRTAPVKASMDNGQTVYSASLRNWIAPTENAHDVVWNDVTQAYGYVVKDGMTDEDFQSVSFYVTGEINDGEWEETDSGISLSVVWDIYYEESSDSASPYTDPDIAPSVKVKAGTRNPGGTVTLRVDMGAGANLMTSVDKVTYLHSDGSLGTIDALTTEPINFYLNSVTFYAPSDLLNASDWKLCLSNESEGSVELDFDPVAEEVIDPNPSVTVLSKASEGGDTVIMDVYFGIGNTAYPIVQRLAYKASDGSASSFLALTKSNITETGATVSLTANSVLLGGSEWKLILANESGQTTALDVDIYSSDIVAREPSADVTSKATVSGDTISLTLDYGAGRSAYPYVDQVVYDSGVIEKSALTISGTTVTFQATEDLLNGRNWKLQLSNRAEETILLDIDIYEEPAVDPTVTVTTQATVAGETAVMTVTWGGGAKKMTSVKEIKYTSSSGDATIRANSITIDDDTISVTFTTTTIKGTDFILVLKNNSGDTKEFPVDLVGTPEPDADPTVTVTSTAHASGETAVMTVNWGGGSKKMTSVKEIQYTGASGSATIPETAISVSGSTISVTFDDTTATGRNFILVLKNASGGTFETAVSLMKPNMTNPTVEVTTQATASAQTAYMTVTDWGSMSSVSHMTYKKTDATEDSVINIGNYLKVSGDTVSLKFTSTTIKGSDFNLVFKDADGVESDPIPVSLIESETPEPEEPVDTPAVDPTVSVTRKASADNLTALLTVDWGSGTKAMDDVKEVKYTNASSQSATITTVSRSGATVSVTFNATSIEGRDFILVLKNASGGTFETAVDLVKAESSNPTVEVTTKVTASAQTAYMTVTDWGSMTSVSHMTYKKADATADSVINIGNYLKVSGNTVSLKFTSTTIKGSDFKLIFKDADGVESAPIPVLLIEGQESDEPGEVDTPAVDPTVTVTQKASTSNMTALLTVNWGSGTKAMEDVKEVKYTNASGQSATITTVSHSGATVSVTFNATSIEGRNFILVLKNASGGTFETAVDLVKANVTNPTVEVTTKVTASAQTAYMTVTDWGSMTAVSHMTYKKAGATEDSVINIGNYLKVSGNTVSLKFTSTTIKGSDFKLIFKDGDGVESNPIPVTLIEEQESDEPVVDTPAVDPTVTVTKVATAAGETATISVNWGSGSKAMTSAKEVKYTNAFGQSASITGTSVKTSGSTVSVTFNATSIAGRDFILVLKNASGATFETPVVIARPVGAPPVVTVTTKAASSTQTAYMTISDWGSMSSVSHMVYTKSTGAETTIVIGNYLKVSGNTISLKFTSTYFKGTDFKVVFRNADGDMVEVPVELIQS